MPAIVNRLVTPRLFLGLLVAASILEIIYLIGLFDRRMAVDGLWLALAFTFVIPLVPPALGLSVIRRRSRFAAVLLIALVVLAWVAGYGAGISKWLTDPILIVGALATLCQTAAALMLVTPAGRRWTQR